MKKISSMPDPAAQRAPTTSVVTATRLENGTVLSTERDHEESQTAPVEAGREASTTGAEEKSDV